LREQALKSTKRKERRTKTMISEANISINIQAATNEEFIMEIKFEPRPEATKTK
jgi:hypothetical protein